MWRVIIKGGKGDVIPVEDLIEHVRGQDCKCGPYLDEGWLSIHHAADARERFEDGYQSKYEEQRLA